MIWYKSDSTITRIIKETAEECGVTPDIVSGVLSCIFNTIVKETANNIHVKFFRIRGFGSICAKGYAPKRSNSKYNKFYEKYKLFDMQQRDVVKDEVVEEEVDLDELEDFNDDDITIK